jgi:hypothetical protein
MKPGRKKSKNPLNKVVQFRMTAKDFNRARGLARMYARGDLSKWLRHAAINGERKYLK